MRKLYSYMTIEKASVSDEATLEMATDSKVVVAGLL